ncbi:MAG TPA: thiamine pyrophosphate-dependent enzyme [Anaerolineae bacterium]
MTTISPDWKTVTRLVLLSRELDDLEERELAPTKIKYQFSSMGHELGQVLLGLALDHPHDEANVYYRSRPFMLACGLTPREALAGGLARLGGPTNGRDVGVTYNLPKRRCVVVPQMSGAVGSQYTPAAGWAQAIVYRGQTLGEKDWEGSIAVALGGDGSVAANGFWAALNIVTTLKLPYLFFIEDNSYGISVSSSFQTPGGNIAKNLAAYGNLKIWDGDGADPLAASESVSRAVAYVRRGEGPALLHLRVPRLRGHTFGEDQRAYKTEEQIAEEAARDPLPRLRTFMLASGLKKEEWDALVASVRVEVKQATAEALELPEPDPVEVTRRVFYDGVMPQQGGLRPEGIQIPPGTDRPLPHDASSPRLNFLDAVRRTLESEMKINSRILVFGEDVGPRGGVHRVTLGLQKEFTDARVFDTSLSEEGIMGRAHGMALAGLMPVPEIQFRKYADPAHEQINDIGSVRWRSDGKFALPMVLRIPVGITRKPMTGELGDPWHSMSGEAVFAHTLGWRLVMPSNAEDAVGLLRTALRGDDPVFFLEHRALLDNEIARRPYPGDNYSLPFGVAADVTQGDELTVVTWGECVYRCQQAAADHVGRVNIIDLRTLVPWDKDKVLASIRRTGKLLVVHEDTITGGFAGEIIAVVAQEAFMDLDAPVERVASADTMMPYNQALMHAVIPSVDKIRAVMKRMLNF